MKKFVTWLWRFTVVLAFIALVFYYHKSIIRATYEVYQEYNWRNYPDQGTPGRVDVPGRYSVHGIDVSRWQTNVNWNKLTTLDRSGDTISMSFAFIKATEGILWEDPAFDDNWKNAGKAGVVRGAYHYFKANSSATLQAKNFISSVKLKAGDLPPVVDVEEAGRKSRQELVASLKIYIAAVEKAYHCKPIIYSNVSFIDTYLADDFRDYQFWIAHYYTAKPKLASKVNWVFWQYHDRAKITGCRQCVDVNVFNGSPDEFDALRIQN